MLQCQPTLFFARAGPSHKDSFLELSLSDGEFQYRIPRLQTPFIMVVLVRYDIVVWVWGWAHVHDTKDRADSRNHVSWWQKVKIRHYFSCVVESNNSVKRTVWKYHELKPNKGALAVNFAPHTDSGQGWFLDLPISVGPAYGSMRRSINGFT